MKQVFDDFVSFFPNLFFVCILFRCFIIFFLCYFAARTSCTGNHPYTAIIIVYLRKACFYYIALVAWCNLLLPVTKAKNLILKFFFSLMYPSSLLLLLKTSLSSKKKKITNYVITI